MNKKTTTLPALLSRHTQLTAQLDALDEQLRANSDAHDQAQADRAQAREQERHALAQIEREAPKTANPDDLAQKAAQDRDVNEARRLEADAQTRMNDSRRRDETLSAQRRALEQERLALCGGSLSDLLTLEDQIEAARVEVSNLDRLIEEHRAHPAPDRTPVNALDEQLAALLARSALGEAVQSELSALEKRRADAQTKHASASEQAERAALLVRGLEDRQAVERARVAELEGQARIAFAWQVRAELDQTIQDFRATAERLFEVRGSLLALAKLTEGTEPDLARQVKALIEPVARQSLRIIGPGLDLIDDYAYRERATERERSRYRQAGLRLLE